MEVVLSFFRPTRPCQPNTIKNSYKQTMSAASSSSTFMQNGLTYALVGGAIGGAIGLLKATKDRYMPQVFTPPSATNADYHKYPNILLDPVVVEALSRFQTYKHLCPQEYETILENLNGLIGMQVAINSGKIESYYAYRATSYATNIKLALNRAKTRARNVSVPHWDVDEASILQLSDDYLYNITQDVNQHMLSSRTAK